MHWLIINPWLVTDLQSLITRKKVYCICPYGSQAKVVAGATMDAESHPTSSHASSKGALTGSRIFNVNRHICDTWQLLELIFLYRGQHAISCKKNVYICVMFLSS